MTDSPRSATVAIVGAGLSGLVAARELSRAGIEVLVLESADRVGGRALAETTTQDSRVDLGGQWIGHDHERLRGLALELGTTPYVMSSRRLPMIVDGEHRVRPFGFAALTSIAALTLLEVLRRLPGIDLGQRSTVASWIRRVPGRRARRVLEVSALISWTADAEQISVPTMFALIRAQHGLATMLKTTGGAQDSLLVEAVGTLPEMLASELGERVHTGCRVVSISRDDSGATIQTNRGEIRAERVIVTAPPPMAKAITHTPPLPEDRIVLQENSFMGTVYKAIAVYESPFWRTQSVAEQMVLGDPGRAIFDSSPPQGPGHLSILVGGSEARGLDKLSKSQRIELLLGPLASEFGAAILEPVGWHEKSWHLDEHAGGGYMALPNLDANPVVIPVSSERVGTVHWAGTETAADHPGYFDGAIESGQRVADEVVRSLR